MVARATPESVGLTVDGDAPAGSDGEGAPTASDATFGEALRSPAFWVFGLASAMYGLIASGIGLFNESILAERGFAPAVYHQALAVTAITALGGNFADLMMVAGKDVEAAVQRLAQMARAAGIHLVMATQRPSVDVITGTIKANFPTRISFKVASKVDSRTILNEQGAEQLLGQGDMLYSAGSGQVVRVHGPYVSDEEVEQVAAHLRSQGVPDYIAGVTDGPASSDDDDDATRSDDGDDLFARATAIVWLKKTNLERSSVVIKTPVRAAVPGCSIETRSTSKFRVSSLVAM
jgi:hypothetical protein